MTAQCVTGKPKPRLFKRRQPNAYQAQRIRFGLLAARATLLAHPALTDEQADYLEGCELHGWMIGDAGTLRAFDRESRRILAADFWAGWPRG